MEIKRSLKEEVAKSAITFWEKGLTPGLDSGDTSLRDPESGLIYILPQPSERQPIHNWACVTCDDVAVIDMQCNMVEQTGCYPTVEAPMHLRIYEARPDVNAIVHSHGEWSQIFAAVHKNVPPVTIDAVHFLGGEVRCAEFGRVATDLLAENVVKALGPDRKAALMAGHGAACVGRDFREAFLVADVLERTAKQAIFAKLIGEIFPVTILDMIDPEFLKGMDDEALEEMGIDPAVLKDLKF